MSKTIIACDFSEKQQLNQLLSQFNEPIYVKLGMEVIYRFGLDLIKEVKHANHKIFLDLKLHDIPNTVYGAIKNLAKLDVDMINVHAAGGIAMMKAAKQAINEINPNIKCIAVTQLTSIDQQALENELHIHANLQDIVVEYALNAKEAGLDGVVCSVHEVQAIHRACGKDFLCVTPGIRLDNNVQDQKRVATPEYAKECGSNYIVVGRSITSSTDPKATFQQIETVMQGE